MRYRCNINHGPNDREDMSSDVPLVSVALPVYNGAAHLHNVAKSVLAQDHERLELVISDNGSTDETSDVAREIAAGDERVVYHRHPHNVGLLNNFVGAMRLARGEYLRWIGDDDWIAPNYVSSCLRAFAEDPRLILVTTQMAYIGADGARRISTGQDDGFASDDPVERFAADLRMLTAGFLEGDPLYGLIRRTTLLGISRRNMLREDEIFGARLALAGPWGHVSEVLAQRHRVDTTRIATARLLGVPVWRHGISSLAQCWELMKSLDQADLTPSQRRRAMAEVAKLYYRRKQGALERAGRKAHRLTRSLARWA
jgi:glycosyltransferase involved in cell wall biosynthesis